jgi:NADH:ubiquinone oxidoreductase subunit 3 (subunit A)
LSCSPGVVLFVRSIFVIVLFFGLLYEWADGSLEWVI